MNISRLLAGSILAGLLLTAAAPDARAVLLNTANFNTSGGYGGTITVGDVKFDVYCGGTQAVCQNVDINTTGSTASSAVLTLTGAGGTALSAAVNGYQDVPFSFIATTVSGLVKMTSLISSWTLSGGSAVLVGSVGGATSGVSPGATMANVSLSAATLTQTAAFTAKEVIGNNGTPFDAHAGSGTTLGSVSFAIGVPEPASIALLLAGVTGLVVSRRRSA